MQIVLTEGITSPLFDFKGSGEVAEPDIRVLVGVEGGSTASGASGQLIRKELEKIAQEIGRDPPKIKLGVNTSDLISQIQKAIDSATFSIGCTSGKKVGTEAFADFSGARVSTKAMSAATAEKTKADIANKNALAQLNIEATKRINALKIEREESKNNVQAIKEEAAVRIANEKAAKVESKAIEDAEKKKQKSIADAAKSKQISADLNKYLMSVKASAVDLKAVDINNIFSHLDNGEIKEAEAAIRSLKAEFKTMGAEGGNVFTYLGEKIKTFSVYLASSAITMGFVNAIRGVVDTTFELDKALVDLRIVTDGSKESAGELIDAYNRMAMELGSTTSAVSSAANDWLRQGYSLADTNTLIKDSMVLSIVGQLESAEATNALTAAMKGYGLAASEVIDVVDKFTSVDLLAATSSGDLAIALSKTAANAKLAGLSLNDVIGQLAVVNETMKEAPESTGTFYNTMLSRMGMIKSGRLEDPESGEALGDVETTLNRLGIELRKSGGEFRNFGDVLDEVGQKWESYSSVNQRAIAQAFAGTRQQTRFISLMNGWGQAVKYSEAAANSAGTAMQKFGAYEEGLEYKTQRNAAAFEHLATVLLDSGIVGGAIDLGTAALQVGAAFDGVPAKIVIVTSSLLALKSAYNSLDKSIIGEGFRKTIEDLGWPEMTGDRLYYCA